jgi:hypothetical protein
VLIKLSLFLFFVFFFPGVIKLYLFIDIAGMLYFSIYDTVFVSFLVTSPMFFLVASTQGVPSRSIGMKGALFMNDG